MSSSRTKRLRGKRIAVLAADGVEHVELAVPVKALRAAGATVEIVALHHGRIRGMNLTRPTRTVKVDRTVAETEAAAYDGLFLPGGFVGPDLLRQSRDARDFVRAFEARQKPIATLCHGPWLLASATIVDGRRLASWPGIRDDVVHAGGIWRDEPVVWDQNWVSSRGPQDLALFVPAMIELFAGGTMPRIAPADDGDSSPPYDEPIPLVAAAARLLPGPTLRTVAAAAAVLVAGAYVRRRLAA